MAARAVTVIPATAGRFAQVTTAAVTMKRVAAYARVSTDNDEQLSSYEAQVDYYTKHIKSNSDWTFVEVYTDEGISATSTKKRDGFNRMISDALDGNIDLIITKSVSRFARNTVDTLTTVRQLKEKGVEVYFEKENIYTLDSKGELLITIMSSLAQEESRSISENVTWGQRKRFADGKVSLPYKQFLGYEKGEDGLPKIVEKEAAVVRLIYKLFLEGKTQSGIAKHLTTNKIPTPAGKEVWQPSTVKSILQNEKYKGDAILQKSFTVDFLTKKKKVNEGEVPQYYVENSHPAIISSEVFDLVQQEMKKRKKIKGYKTSGICFSGKIVCGECGSFYGSKVWHSTSKYRRVIWQCNSKFKNDKKCGTPHIYEDKIKQAFVEAFNSLLENKDEILKGYEEIIQALTDTTKLDKESSKLQSEMDIITEMLRKCVEENAHSALNQAEYEERYKTLLERYESIKKGLEAIDEKRLERSAKQENITAFIKELEQREDLILEFDEELWLGTVDKVIVNTEEKITFVFKDEMELEDNI
ncbi:recombinase family protein [Clostridium botulinum]|uniref:recombinase family protein n=1 Tax=Clostridium botulinum TaxID=1491 RepID=UPI000772EDCC|nr:recombinase family protein [Clostridium botulinum]NFE96383.1 recombinase family protein [Clostridium botulinum]NFL39885.1 recombinase family protein [Clostridium botulinum]NFL66908.1 recombinase family protein [Clostridium botulinum]NFN09761.1 recombinase family protein [Clostridium botulinum]NFN26481.1 recombinase family protein [Clostridium botulinum]